MLLISIIICITTGTSCIGHSLDFFEDGSSVDDVIENLFEQFCGCVHVTGNIRINMHGLEANLTEESFNFFYHLEEITGAFLFHNIPTTSRIILPNLRLIRGRELFSFNRYALTVRNISVGEFILPKLTEISNGSVLIEQLDNKRLCNVKRIKWQEIVDNGTITISTCSNPTREGMTNRFIL